MRATILQNKGFSLIELMIAIAILGITLTLALPSFGTWTQNARIRNTAESVMYGLQLARAEAVKRNANVQLLLNGGASWTVGCVTVVSDLNGDGVDDCPEIIQEKNAGEDNATDITLQATQPGPYIFSGLGRVSPAPAGNFIQFNVDSSKLEASKSRDLRINLSIGGTIRMCDPTVTSLTDIRRCPL